MVFDVCNEVCGVDVVMKMSLAREISTASPKNNIFLKLLAAFLVGMMLIYFTGIIIYTWGVNTIKTEIINRNIAQLQVYFDVMEKEVDQITTLQSRYLTGREISWLVNTYNSISIYERGYLALRVQDNMVALKNSSNYVMDVALYMPDIGRKILASSGYDEIEPADIAVTNMIARPARLPLSTNGDQLYK